MVGVKHQSINQSVYGAIFLHIYTQWI